MNIVNQGDWARDAIDLDFDTRKEYEEFRNQLAHSESRVAEIAHRSGQKIHLWFLIDGHKFIVHVPKENGEKEELTDVEYIPSNPNQGSY